MSDNNTPSKEPSAQEMLDFALAVARGNETFIQKFIEDYSTLPYTKFFLDAALIRAAVGGHKNIAILALENGADVDTTGSENKTALMVAEERGHTEIVALLKQAKELKEQKERERAAAVDARVKKLHKNRPQNPFQKKG